MPWVPSEADINALQSYDSTELVISGIYIRLFVANPGWVLRKPREFLTDLLEAVLRLMGQPNPNMEVLETVTTALVKLLEAQPALSDMVPATGYLSRILNSMNSADGDVQKPGVLIINELSRYVHMYILKLNFCQGLFQSTNSHKKVLENYILQFSLKI